MPAMISKILSVPSEHAAFSIVMLFTAGLIFERIKTGNVPTPNKENKNVKLKQEEINAQPVFSFLIILGIFAIDSIAAKAMRNSSGLSRIFDTMWGI